MLPAISSPNAMSPDAPRWPRRSWTRAEQAAHLADFAASGLSATAFCRRLGVGRPIALTPFGRTLRPCLAALSRWAKAYHAAVGATLADVDHAASGDWAPDAP